MRVTAVDVNGASRACVARRMQRVVNTTVQRPIHPRRERLCADAAAAARSRDAVDVPGAQRRLHARRGSHSRRRVRSQQDPGRRAPRASRRVVLADSVPARALLARRRVAPQGILRRPIRPRSMSVCASWWARSRSSTRLLANAEWDTPVRELSGYAANVKAMHGNGLRAARQRRGVSRSGVLLRRHDRDALGEHGGGSARPSAARRARGLDDAVRAAAAQGRRYVSRVRAGVVRRPLPGHHVFEDATARQSAG